MTAVNLTTLLKKANKNNYAVAGLVVLGWEDALAYTQAADETGIPRDASFISCLRIGKSIFPPKNN